METQPLLLTAQVFGALQELSCTAGNNVLIVQQQTLIMLWHYCDNWSTVLDGIGFGRTAGGRRNVGQKDSSCSKLWCSVTRIRPSCVVRCRTAHRIVSSIFQFPQIFLQIPNSTAQKQQHSTVQYLYRQLYHRTLAGVNPQTPFVGKTLHSGDGKFLCSRGRTARLTEGSRCSRARKKKAVVSD